jgi:hypothetical protein
MFHIRYLSAEDDKPALLKGQEVWFFRLLKSPHVFYINNAHTLSIKQAKIKILKSITMENFTDEQKKELAAEQFTNKLSFVTFLPKTEHQKVDLWEISTSSFKGFGITKHYNASHFSEDEARIRFNWYVYNI